jgi:hypothetical protein
MDQQKTVVVLKWDCKRFKHNNDNADRISSILKHNSDGKDIETQQNRPLGRPRQRWDNNIEIDLIETECECVGWINLAHLLLCTYKCT